MSSRLLCYPHSISSQISGVGRWCFACLVDGRSMPAGHSWYREGTRHQLDRSCTSLRCIAVSRRFRLGEACHLRAARLVRRPTASARPIAGECPKCGLDFNRQAGCPPASAPLQIGHGTLHPFRSCSIPSRSRAGPGVRARGPRAGRRAGPAPSAAPVVACGG